MEYTSNQWKKTKDYNMKPVGLGNTRLLPNNLTEHCFKVKYGGQNEAQMKVSRFKTMTR